MNKKLSIILLGILLLFSACAPKAVTESPAESAVSNPPAASNLKIAVLPIIDTLPMYVAQQEGLFAKHGVNVEFVPVASAPERDQLLAAGGADGTINETLDDPERHPILVAGAPPRPGVTNRAARSS